MTKGDAMTTGAIVDRLTECPVCKGQGRSWGRGGCPICVNGMVKQVNVDRARRPLPSAAWPAEALDRLWRLLTEPRGTRRERRRIERQLLEEWDQQRPSRLDTEDKRERGNE